MSHRSARQLLRRLESADPEDVKYAQRPRNWIDRYCYDRLGLAALSVTKDPCFACVGALRNDEHDAVEI
jgi:hypothetical protein